MTKSKRQPESELLQRSRGELLTMAGELGAIKRRATALRHRLEQADKEGARVVGELDGEAWSEERWLSGAISCAVVDNLQEVIRNFTNDGRGVPRHGLAAAIARAAARDAKHEKRIRRAMALLSKIKAAAIEETKSPGDAWPGIVIVCGPITKLQARFRPQAYELAWLRRCYSNTAEGEQAWRHTLANHDLTPEIMSQACGGRY